MSYRFKASKYKNATPKVPKKVEGWILDVSVGSPQCFGNNIKASGAFMAFSTDTRGGGSLAVLSLEDAGRKNKAMPLLHAHAETISDFDFSPFDDGLLATGSSDRYVKLWRIRSGNGVNVEHPSNPELVLPPFQSRVESILFHPCVDSVFATAHSGNVSLWDLVQNEPFSGHSCHEDVVQSLSFKADGSLIASSGRDRNLNVYDPRSSKIAYETKGHANHRDSRILWLGDTDSILTTGFGTSREREACFWDTRKFTYPISTITGECSLGVLIPLYDPDTKMLFLAAKADTTVCYFEVVDNDPFYSEATRFTGEVQVKGIALVPKRAMQVMTGEVNRVLLLGSDCVVPIKYTVPRKSYRDFHSDLFPDTRGAEPSMTFKDWMNGKNAPVQRISLDPTRRPPGGLLKFDRVLGSEVEEQKPAPVTTRQRAGSGPLNINSNQQNIQKPQIPSPSMLRRSQHSISRDWEEMNASENDGNNSSSGTKPYKPPKPSLGPKPYSPPLKSGVSNGENQANSNANNKNWTESKEDEPVKAPNSPTVVLRRTGQPAADNVAPLEASPAPAASNMPRRSRFSVRVTKFRHLNGELGRKETHITNLSKLSKAVPGECDVMHINYLRAAMPLAGEGGHLAVIELSKRGRMQSGVVPSIICGATIMDFAWDPFNLTRLAVSCDDGTIQIWHLPESGLAQSITEPSAVLKGHVEKVQIVKFNTTAKDILASASYDLTVRVWDLTTNELKILLNGHTDQIFSMAWSPDGKCLATVCKDQKLRVYDPRSSVNPVKEGPGPQGSRGARCVWVMNGSHIVTTGFSRVSERLISLYDLKDLSTPIATEGLDVSPSILVPFYDEDSSTLFLTGRGDSTVFAFEVAKDGSCFHPLSHYKCQGAPHQAVSFLPKNACDVARVEFARSFRLTPNSIEPLTFCVPRLRKEFFQDDLFPDTRVTWEPTFSSADWLNQVSREVKRVSLKPEGMPLLSEAPSTNKTTKGPARPNQSQGGAGSDVRIQFEGDVMLESSLAFLQGTKQKEERIIQAMTDKLNYEGQTLPQDSCEGVDPNEWDEDGSQKNKA